MSRRTLLTMIGAAGMLAACGDNPTGVRWAHVPTPTPLTPGPDENLRALTRSLCLKVQHAATGIPAQQPGAPVDALATQLSEIVDALGPEWVQFPDQQPSPSEPPAAQDAVAAAQLAEPAEQVYPSVVPQLTDVAPSFALVIGSAAATLRVWGMWLPDPTAPLVTPTVGSPPEPSTPSVADAAAESSTDDASADGSEVASEEVAGPALAARHAAIYHYGVLAGQNVDAREELAGRLAHVEAEAALLSSFASARGETVPAAAPGYQPLDTSDVRAARAQIERGCVAADRFLLRKVAGSDREWACKVLTRSGVALANVSDTPQNLCKD